MSASKGTTNVQVKNSHVGAIIAGLCALIVMGGLGNMGQIALTGAGAVADHANPCNPAEGRVFCPPARVSGSNGMNRGATPTTPTSVPGVSDDEMAARQAAKTMGDNLPPIAPITPAPGVPTLANPNGGGTGILGELPVIGGAIEGAAKALGPGMKALNP